MVDRAAAGRAPLSASAVGDWRSNDEDFLATFHLPSASDKMEVLAEENQMQRDSRIVFQEEEHIYFVDGKQVPKSVTAIVHYFEPEFDADKILARMQPRRRIANSRS